MRLFGVGMALSDLVLDTGCDAHHSCFTVTGRRFRAPHVRVWPRRNLAPTQADVWRPRLTGRDHDKRNLATCRLRFCLLVARAARAPAPATQPLAHAQHSVYFRGFSSSHSTSLRADRRRRVEDEPRAHGPSTYRCTSESFMPGYLAAWRSSFDRFSACSDVATKEMAWHFGQLLTYTCSAQ